MSIADRPVHAELLEKYNATREELRIIRRWALGRRRERFSDADGQRHLFDMESVAPAEADSSKDFEVEA